MGTSRRAVLRMLAGLVVATGGTSWMEACAGTNTFPAQSLPHSMLPAHPGRGTTLLTYYGQLHYKVDPLAWSPDGKRLASGYIAESLSLLQVWDANTGKTMLSCKHGQNVYGVAWSPDSKRVASGGGDNRVHVWDAAQGKDATTTSRTLLIYVGHTGSVIGVAWSPDGTRIASGSTDPPVQVWEATTGKTLLTYTGHSAPVTDVKWSADGKLIATGSGDTTVQVWEATTGRVLFTSRVHTDVVFSVAWSPDGTRLASASADTTVQVWEAR